MALVLVELGSTTHLIHQCSYLSPITFMITAIKLIFVSSGSHFIQDHDLLLVMKYNAEILKCCKMSAFHPILSILHWRLSANHGQAISQSASTQWKLPFL